MSRNDSLLNDDQVGTLKNTVFDRHPLEEQFRDFDQQTEVATFGMWLFLATEVMFFGTLFVSLAIYRYFYATAFETASRELNWQIATANTLVLLFSSCTMAMAVYHAQLGNRTPIVRYLIVTAVLGATFLVLKGCEYYIDYQEYLIPGWRFDDSKWTDERGLAPSQVPAVKLFLTFYWVMTSIHAIHMVVGIALVSVIAVLAARGVFSRVYYSPVDVAGLYWHFVDGIWIFLLPALYLLGTHSFS